MAIEVDRRAFGGAMGAAMLLAGTSAPAATPAGSLSAADVIERIKGKLASEKIIWQPGSTDTIKIGSATTQVTGIATTFQASLDVLQRAAAAKLNFVISHERLFWDFIDEVGPLSEDRAARIEGALENDPILTAKRRFCEENDIVVWRFHDHWHMHDPDPIIQGLVERLGWEAYLKPDGYKRYDLICELPKTTLGEVAKHVKARLGTSDVCVIGEPSLPVSRVSPLAHNIREMHSEMVRADVVLVGETEEFDVFHYMRDAMKLGVPHPKAMIVISHERFEEFGMERAVPWLRPLFPQVPVRHVPSGNPYWTLSST